MSGFVGLLRTMERLSRPLGSDHDGPLADTPNPYEPGLSDDELVATRQLIEERFGDQTGSAGHGLAGFDGEAVSGIPPSPASPYSDDMVAEWIGNAVPVISKALAEHAFWMANYASLRSNAHCGCGSRPHGAMEWRDHIAPIIAEALAPQPK